MGNGKMGNREYPYTQNVSGCPLDPSSTKNHQVDSNNNNMGESNMIKEKVIKTHNF